MEEKRTERNAPFKRKLWGTKNGKLPTSHCYNLIPLLRSRPGGFKGS